MKWIRSRKGSFLMSFFLFQNPHNEISVVFCGDFNSTPECGVYKLFTTNFVPETYHEWKYGIHVRAIVMGFFV